MARKREYSTAELASALARLTDAARSATHVDIYSLAVVSLDGKRCSINVRVSGKRVYRNTLNQIADELRVTRGQIEDVLDNWTREQLVGHLSQFSSTALDCPACERRFLTESAE